MCAPATMCSPNGVDWATHLTAQKLAVPSLTFLKDVQFPSATVSHIWCGRRTYHSTTGKESEKWSHRNYGPGSAYYEDFCKYIHRTGSGRSLAWLGENSTHHYPRARGGWGVAFFSLPSGRIAYEARPGEQIAALCAICNSASFI